MRVLLADDQREVRSALRLLLEQHPSVSVVGEAQDAKELLRRLPQLQPDVLLLDWELPGRKTDGLVPKICRQFPNLRIIALSGFPEAEKEALAAGSAAFVSKGDPPEAVWRALNLLHKHTA